MSEHSELIHSILKDNNGYITTAQVTSAGIPRRCLNELVLSGDIYKADRGIYTLPETWEDEMYFLQYRFSKGIYSHGTALYLHALTDRTPHRYTMTTPHGYNAGGARKQGIVIKAALPGLFELGITEVASPCSNPLKVYDVERTLCDIVRGRNADDIQLVNQAMKAYAASSKKDIAKLIDYAEKLRVKSKILRYMEVLL
jgi:hypothetical protein